jgi:hypothetical protein
MRALRKRDQSKIDAEAEHRRREDGAPRLRDAITRLESLRLRFDDIRGEGRLLASSYVRPVVVAVAPAHFEVRCLEPRCNGRHDLTNQVLQALRQSSPVFTGQSDCDGTVGMVSCDRTLAYTGEASYRG